VRPHATWPTEVYGHLPPDYLRAEVDRFSFGVCPAPAPEFEARAPSQPFAGIPKPFVPAVSRVA
jgi:hypothetical protein